MKIRTFVLSLLITSPVFFSGASVADQNDDWAKKAMNPLTELPKKEAESRKEEPHPSAKTSGYVIDKFIDDTDKKKSKSTSE